jgi:hypothetical protein
LPLDDNAFISNRPWSEKRVLYRALSADSPDVTGAILEDAIANGLALTDEKAAYIVERRQHLPMLQSLSAYEGEWNRPFIEARTRHLLGRAWDVLVGWL